MVLGTQMPKTTPLDTGEGCLPGVGGCLKEQSLFGNQYGNFPKKQKQISHMTRLYCSFRHIPKGLYMLPRRHSFSHLHYGPIHSSWWVESTHMSRSWQMGNENVEPTQNGMLPHLKKKREKHKRKWAKGKGAEEEKWEDRRWEEEEGEWGEEGKRSLFLGKSCKLPLNFGTSFQINIVEGA